MRVEPTVVRLHLAETFVIAREARDWEDVVQVELHHDGTVGRGEAAPIERYDETPESARAFIEEHASLIGDDPFALEEIGARLGGGPGRACRQGGARRRSARPSGQAARGAGLAPARAAAGRPPDILDGLARRSGRHGTTHRAGGGSLQAPEAEARRRRRPRRRAREGGPLADRPTVAGRRQRVVVARARHSMRSRSSPSSESPTSSSHSRPATPAPHS